MENDITINDLAPRQKEFVHRYVDNEEHHARTAKSMGWKSVTQVVDMLKQPKVAAVLYANKMKVVELRASSTTFNITRSQKLELLWKIAETGADMGFDKMGNQIMLNPGVSVTAIREMNLMVGDHEATKSEVQITKIDRTEAELVERIRMLRNEFENLVAIDGELVSG